MTIFIGDYTCKIDAKGRVMLPAAFKKQMPQAAQDRFVIKKDIYEKCLVLYPMDEWERQNQLIRQNINPYNKEHNRFLREFFKDTAEVETDSNNRFVIPSRLLNLVDIGKEKEVVLAGQLGKIEIWSKELYDKTSEEIADFGALADKILGGNINKPSE
ncbi:MAG: division/cell wall cluster transcriptional repressor MraZ [Bacteroidota bacterium]|nr:division/cell wall cluster transcriptional repressor MraZ [Bacteroidota bacterium]